MPIATLTSKGQVTVPKEVRDHLHVDAGDRLEFRIEEDGTVRLATTGSRLAELEGMLRRPGRRPVSLARMKEVIAREGGRR